MLMLAVWASISRGMAQIQDFSGFTQEPSWSVTRPQFRYLETDIEAERDTYDSKGINGKIESTRLYVSPRIGIGWNNYIYHPYLLSYSILAEPGYVWEHRDLNNQGHQSDEFIVNGTATATLLQVKPYATTVSYSRSHEEVKYDFFNTATVDLEGFGATTGYRDGPVPVTASFSKTHEESVEFDQKSITDQTLVNLSARNERKDQDVTALDYQYNEFNRETALANTSLLSQNTYNHATLTDAEHFEHSFLNSSVRFNDRQAQTSSSSDVNVSEDYKVEHSPNLHSYYDYSFSHFSGDGYDSDQNYAIAGLQHQLYESLGTGVEVHGSTLNSRADASSLDSFSVGSTVSADYTKRIGSWGRLTINNSSSYNYNEQDTRGAEVVVANESYTVPLNGLVRLTQPRQISIASVTDASGNPLQAGLDYNVIRATDPWQIQIITTGPSHIQSGSIILVTYTIQSNPSGHYSVEANQAYVRLSLWGDLTAVYVRYNVAGSQASSSDFLIQDEELLETGIEFNWHNLRLNADYINDHTTLFDYVSYNLVESYSITLFSDSHLGIDLNQQWADNSFGTGTATNVTEHMTFYSYMLHYDWRPIPSLTWNVEVGYRQQRGLGLDQDLFAARTYLNWYFGKLQAHFGYEHGFQDIQGESRDRDFLFLKARRSF